MDKKELLKIVIKVLIYALGLIGAYFGVSSMTSCTASHNIDACGTSTIITTDTTIVKHGGYLRFKNYPYEFKN